MQDIITPLEGLGERKALLTQIIEQMPPGAKKVNWVEYFNGHPREAALLGYKRGTDSHTNKVWNRNNVMATHLIRTGVVHRGIAVAPGENRNPLASRIRNHPANIKALAEGGAELKPYKIKRRANYDQADYKLAASIAEVYKRPDITGRLSVDWHAAFEKHPEWREQLQGRRSVKALQAFLARVRHKIQKGKLVGNGAEDVKEILTSAVDHPSAPDIANDIEYGSTVKKLTAENERLKAALQSAQVLKHCPECGLNLAMHQRAYEIAMKHSR